MDSNLSLGSIRFMEPISYFDMLVLERHCKVIITDSGGIQKEAFFLRNLASRFVMKLNGLNSHKQA